MTNLIYIIAASFTGWLAPEFCIAATYAISGRSIRIPVIINAMCAFIFGVIMHYILNN